MAEVRRRSSHTANVRPRPEPEALPPPAPPRRRVPIRPRDVPEADAESRRFMDADHPLYGLQTTGGTIAAETTTRQTMADPGEGKRLRIAFIEFWMDASGPDVVEVYWGEEANYAAAGLGEKLWNTPINSAYERVPKTYGIGLGPVGRKDTVLSMRRSIAPAGKTLHWTLWYTLEN
jgi:hypothetical protein